MGGTVQGPQQSQGTSGTSNSTTQPWGPAIPVLTPLLDRIGGINPTPTDAQTNAGNRLVSDTSAIPNFGPASSEALTSILGTNTQPAQNELRNTATALESRTAPISDYYSSLIGGGANSPLAASDAAYSRMLDPNFTNPMTNPQLGSLLATTNNDIGNQINSTWSAAGRTGSPGSGQALARGLSQGEAGILTNEYNQLLNTQLAAGSGLNANTATRSGAASGLNSVLSNNATFSNAASTGGAALQQQDTNNRIAGINLAQPTAASYAAPGMQALAAAMAQYGIPLQNIQGLLGLTTPVAGLGATQSGTTTGTGTTSTQQPLLTTALGLGIGGAGALGALGQGASGLGSILAGI